MGESQNQLGLKIVGRLLGLAILLGAVVIGYRVIKVSYFNPRTDDASVRANIVGIAPQVSGALVQLNVADNQEVNEGDLLFVIDSQPYEAELARYQAELLLARSELQAMSNSISSATSEISARQAELELATTDVKRYEPLLKDRAIDAETVDEARTRQRTAQDRLLEAQQALQQQQNLLGQHGTLNARIGVAEANVRSAQIKLDYCRVRAPFKARVSNLNTSTGQYARAGEPLFALVDMRRWYVVANYRETFLPSIKPGMSVDIFLMAYPERLFHGKVQGVGWAVQGQDASTLGVLVEVKPNLNWVRFAQRIPVRIEIEEADPNLPYRMGMTAIVTIQGKRGNGPETAKRGL
jgi:multidrug resistance efflux pump